MRKSEKSQVKPLSERKIAKLTLTETANALAENSQKTILLALAFTVRQIRALYWSANPEQKFIILTKKETNPLANAFLEQTRSARRSLAELSKKDFSRLNTRNQLLLQNYLRLETKIEDSVTDLQIGSEAEIAVAIAMLDYYLDDLATVSPPPIVR